jgi:tetratricopeptide (TPR) repeat protein
LPKLRHARVYIATAIATAFLASAVASVCAYSAQDDAELFKLYQRKPDRKPAAEKAYGAGMSLLLKGNCLAALPLLQEATKVDAGCAGAYAAQGYCESFLGQDTDAIKSLNKAIAVDSNNATFYYRKGLYLYSVLRFKDAIEVLNRALELKPQDMEALRLRARSYRKTGDISRAIADYTSLIDKNFFTTEALCERGNLNFTSDYYEKALADFNSALALYPDLGEAFAGRGTVFYRLGKYQLAMDNFTAAVVCGTDKAAYCRMTIDECKRKLRLAK